eukprot:5476679-Pyramimonas_sp.AAC.1
MPDGDDLNGSRSVDENGSGQATEGARTSEAPRQTGSPSAEANAAHQQGDEAAEGRWWSSWWQSWSGAGWDWSMSDWDDNSTHGWTKVGSQPVR